MWWSFGEVVRGILNPKAVSRNYRNKKATQYWPGRSWSVLATMAVDFVHTLGNRSAGQTLACRTLSWCNAFKTSVNSFLGVHERENVCANSEFIFFVGTCVIEFSKFNETLVLVLSLSIDGADFGRNCFSSPIACLSSLWFDCSVTIFFLHASMLWNILYFWFLNWIEKFPLSVLCVLSRSNLLREGYRSSNCCYFV